MSSIAVTPGKKQRAPTLYAIIAIKLLKGALFITLAICAYSLSDNNLPEEFKKLLQWLHWNPERAFFANLAEKIGKLTEANLLWAAAGTFLYSLFSLVEGIGLMFRITWAGWLAVGESLFFIPIEIYELKEGWSLTIFTILILNIVIVWYLVNNRHRLFRHH